MMNRRNFQRPEPSRRDITAVVKWFNPTKGFGFVQPTDGSPDAFLHASVVEQAGHHDIAEGATIVCDIAEGQKGPQVAVIHSVGAPSADFTPRPARRPHGGPGMGMGGGGMGMSGGMGGGGMGMAGGDFEGTVKFYNAEKGFGFITPDDGGKDVFVSARTVERAGLTMLEPNQRVRGSTRMGQKGPMAESLEIL